TGSRASKVTVGHRHSAIGDGGSNSGWPKPRPWVALPRRGAGLLERTQAALLVAPSDPQIDPSGHGPGLRRVAVLNRSFVVAGGGGRGLSAVRSRGAEGVQVAVRGRRENATSGNRRRPIDYSAGRVVEEELPVICAQHLEDLSCTRDDDPVRDGEGRNDSTGGPELPAEVTLMRIDPSDRPRLIRPSDIRLSTGHVQRRAVPGRGRDASLT